MGAWEIEIQNIAGIRSASATIYPGINAVQAENWRGKSSFIAAVETAMGTAGPLTEGTGKGAVRLETPDEVYDRELARRNGQVVIDGDPYLTDEYDCVCADLFAFLDGTNEVRQSVRSGDNLESVLIRPLDFENLDDRIKRLQHERDRVTAEIGRVRDAAEALSAAEETVTELERHLVQLRARRDDLDRPDETEDETSLREDLSEMRAERDRLTARIDRLRESLERAETTLTDRRDELESLDDVDHPDVSGTLSEERDELATVERDIELLQSVYGAAKRLTEEDRFDLLAEVEHGVVEDSVTCLLCGQTADRSEFAAHLEAIGGRVADLRGKAADHRDRIDDLEALRTAREEVDRRRVRLEADIAGLADTIAEREESLEQAETQRDELDDRIESLAEAVDDLDDELTDVESEIKYVEAELEEARLTVDDLASKADGRERLEAKRDGLTEEMESLRNRKDRMKRRARGAFDEAMADLLERFEIGFESARLTASFDLVVARDGREASLDALSEGELELLGLVAALAGHQAFEVDEIVPLFLLDDLGGLSDDSLHAVVNMLQDHVDRVVLTAYPEHSSFDGNAIDPSSWSVVSDQSAARRPS